MSNPATDIALNLRLRMESLQPPNEHQLQELVYKLGGNGYLANMPVEGRLLYLTLLMIEKT